MYLHDYQDFAEGTWPLTHLADDMRGVGSHAQPSIAARQQARLNALVAFARKRSPYYRSLYWGLPSQVEDPCHLPPVTKPELMENFDYWVTDPEVIEGVDTFVKDLSSIGEDYLGRYVVFTTSGTTGVPALLVQDGGALSVMNALAYVRGQSIITTREYWEILGHGNRRAAVFATGYHSIAAVMMERSRREHPWLKKTSRIFSALTPMGDLVRELNAFRPAVLGGYASALALLAEEREAGRLGIDPFIVTSSSEPLTPTVRARVEAAFGVRAWETYGACEASPLALPCRHGRLHINADWFILEPVDEGYEPVPPGQLSHSVLVTNLANRVQPIIRYDLGDRVLVDPDPCHCGSPLPTLRVEGRTNDVLSFEAPSGRIVKLLPMALDAVVNDDTLGVHRFQAIKTAPKTLSVRLEVEARLDHQKVWEAVECRLREYLLAHGLSSVTVERDPEPPRTDPKSGKFRQVWTESVGDGAP